MRQLRDDQHETLKTLRQVVGEGKLRVCCQAPTGFGKTVLAAAIVRHARDKGKRLLYTVPAVDLVDQTVEMFYQQGIGDIGVIQAHHRMTDWSKPVQIASVQTLMKREAPPQASVVLIDECHKWFTYYGQWFQSPDWQRVPFIGMSATPWTKGLGAYYSERVVAATTQELIDKGLLSDFRVYAPSHPDLSSVQTVAGDYHEGQLSGVMQEGGLMADAVETWKRLAQDRPTLCYAVDRPHAKMLQEKFMAAGVPCGYQDAKTHKDERGKIKRQFHSGELKVVVSVGTLTMGIDWDVRCISLCRPTKSDMLFTQIIGRGLRTAREKDFCLILDHSDNHSRLGFVTDIDASYEGLHDGKSPTHSNRTANIPLPKECPNCGWMKPPRKAVCPMCSHRTVAVCSITPEEGELRELKRPPKAPKPQIDKRTFYAELRAYGLLHGYKDGRAANQYREKTGVWPANDMRNTVPAGTVSAETRGWIVSRRIAYAKSKRGTNGQAGVGFGVGVAQGNSHGGHNRGGEGTS